jgi:guanylate kinase
VDVSGVRQLRGHGLGGMVVFVAPPSVEELAARLGRAAGSSSSGSGASDSAQEALARAAELDLSW